MKYFYTVNDAALDSAAEFESSSTDIKDVFIEIATHDYYYKFERNPNDYPRQYTLFDKNMNKIDSIYLSLDLSPKFYVFRKK